MRKVALGDTELEVDVRGGGEPVVLIQTALGADELVPLADQPPLRDEYQVVVYHRRGYGGSGPVEGPGSVVRDATDCRELLAALDIDRAHVLGVSYSGAVALQLAADTPGLVHSLTVMEPPPVHIPAADEFVAANAELLEKYNRQGAVPALDSFLTRVIGTNWRADLERHAAGTWEEIERDASTFFETDIPALLSWEFGAEAAGRISQPTLHIGGSDSGPWFAQVRRLVLDWLPHAEEVVVAGADHSLHVTHAAEIAPIIAGFLRRHPLPRLTSR